MESHSASTINPTISAQPTNSLVAPTISYISPWLSPLAYLLGRHLVLPLFFGNIKITGQENIPRTEP